MHLDGGHRQKPIDFQRRQFQNGRLAAMLVFWFPDSNFNLALNINSKLQRHYTYVYGQDPIDFQLRHFQNGCLAAILDFSVSRLGRRHGFRSISQVCFGISVSNFRCMLMVVIGRSLLIFTAMSLSKWSPGSHIGFLGFQALTLIWPWISTPNFSGTILMYMDRSLLIFSDVNFKMAAWRPHWIFWFPESNFSLPLNINSKLQWHSTYAYG